jgi:hypothetical protein
MGITPSLTRKKQMPNWTHNTFTIEAPKEKIVELKKKFKSKDNVFDFNKIIPMPKNSKKFKAKGGITSEQMMEGNNWYVWSNINWGTKWNSVDAEIVDESPTHVKYAFLTAWDAPRGITQSFFAKDCDTLVGCTKVEWYCTHEYDREPEYIIQTEKKDKK